MIQQRANFRRIAQTCFWLCCLAAGVFLGAAAKASQVSGYILGQDDQISIRVIQAPDLIDKPVRIDAEGYIELPFVGRVKAGGLTPEALKAELKQKLRTVVNDPEVSITIDDFRSQPVSVMGAVNTPGVQQLRGRKTLLEMISLAGGLRQDSGNTVTLTRRREYGPIGVAGEAEDASGKFVTAAIDLRSLMEGRNPGGNVAVQPNDVISVPRARMIYVIGEVVKTGGFVISDRDQMSVLEALSLAGGLNRTASPQSARILRANAGDARTEVPIDVSKVLNGKLTDQQLRAEDILFIPGSTAKRVSIRALEAAIQVGTGMAIWRR